MVGLMNKNYLFGAIIFIIIVTCALFFIQSTGSQTEDNFSATYDTQFGTVSLNTKLPESPSSITMYRVIPSENDTAEYLANGSIAERYNLPSETEAPQAAENALIPYGGLPDGAKLVHVETEYIEEFNGFTGEVVAKYPVTMNVQYNRLIDGKPVVGDGGFIRMDLGDYGELISLLKIWRTVSSDETVPIIPVSAAIDKIKRGELLGHKPKCACQLNVDKISLGYYEKDLDEPQEFLEPVWIFSGNLSSGGSWNYYVYARESVNTSTTTVHVSVQRKTIVPMRPSPNNSSHENPVNDKPGNTTITHGNLS
jgi:hypothetical protein